MQKVMITLPDGLLSQTDLAAKSLNQNRSEFIRIALNDHLAALKQQEFESLLAEGYQAMADAATGAVTDAAAAQTQVVDALWVWDEE